MSLGGEEAEGAEARTCAHLFEPPRPGTREEQFLEIQNRKAQIPLLGTWRCGDLLSGLLALALLAVFASLSAELIQTRAELFVKGARPGWWTDNDSKSAPSSCEPDFR